MASFSSLGFCGRLASVKWVAFLAFICQGAGDEDKSQKVRSIDFSILGRSVAQQPGAGRCARDFHPCSGSRTWEGQAYTYTTEQTNIWNIPTLEFLLSGSPAATNYLANMPFDFKGSLDSSWLDPRDDVWCVHYDSQAGRTRNVLATPDANDVYTGVGPLSPGFGFNINFGSMFGLELAMGTRLGDSTGAPVFLFKSDRGGTTLGNDWRPPVAVSKRGGVVGINYTNTVARFSEFLDGLDADLADDGVINAYGNATAYRIAGVVWFQGWSEQFNDGPYTAAQMQAEYAENLKDLIYSIRLADARIPGNVGFVVGESSDQSPTINAARISAVDDLNREIPGSAVYFDSAQTKSVDWGNNDFGAPFTADFGFHFHARAENYLEIGWKAGGAVIDSGFLGESEVLYLGFPTVNTLAFNQAEVAATINDDAEQVYIVWDTIDHGTDDVGDWPGVSDLGAWLGGAGEIAVTLGALAEDTTFFYRFFASSGALGIETWSPSGTFTTPFENPPPLFGAPGNTPATTDSTTIDCELTRAASTSTQVVWAFADQGETGAAGWASAPGGGSADLGATAVDTLVSYTIGGLEAGSGYVVRLIASNDFGTVWSAPLLFRTAREADDWVLTAYYDFEPDGDPYDDPAGDSADDLVVQFNPAVSADTAPEAKGSTQSAIFDGNSALSTDAYSTDLGPDPSAYTIMFWVKGRDIDQENNNTRLMTTRVLPDGTYTGVNFWQVEGFGNDGANGDKMNLRMNGPGFGTNNWFQPDAINALARSDQGESEADWHHVAFVVSSSGHSTDQGAFGFTFVDGVKVGGEYGGPHADWDGKDLSNQTGQLIIGGHLETAGNRAFTGLLDDVALFAGIVPDAEITAIANGLKSPGEFLRRQPEFEITAIEVLSDGQIQLTWNSEPGAVYTIFWGTDLSDLSAELGNDYASGGETTTAIVDNPTVSPEDPDGSPELFLRVGKNP